MSAHHGFGNNESGDNCVDCGKPRIKNSKYCAPCTIGNAIEREGRDRHSQGWNAGFRAGFKEGVATGLNAAMQAEVRNIAIETMLADKNYGGVGERLLENINGGTP